MKDKFNFFGIKRLGGSSEASGKRRVVNRRWKKRQYEDEPLIRPVVIGFIPLPGAV